MRKTYKILPEIQVWKNDSKRKYIYGYSSRIVGGNLGAFYVEGGSVSVQSSLAKDKAIFEAIERYSASKIPIRLRKSSYKKIQDRAVDPNNFIFFTAYQHKKKDFPYKKYITGNQIEWVKGNSLINLRELFIPAFAVYLGYNQKIPDLQRYFPTTSCGLAVHTTKRQAIIHGIFELIERDTAMKIWLNKLSAPIVNLSTIHSLKLKRLLVNIKKEDLIPEVILASQELPVPSFIGIVYSSKNAVPFITIGLSTGVDVEKAILKSLEEALMVRNTLEYAKKEFGKLVYQKSQSHVKSFFNHALYYSLPKKKIYWEFMIKGNSMTIDQIKKKFPLKDLQQNTYNSLIDILRKFGYDTYAVNLTSNIARQMGLYCFKVVIPNLRQMEIDHNLKFLKYGSRIDQERLRKSKPHPFA